MKHFSEDTKRKMSEAAIRRCNAEWRKRQSERLSTKLDLNSVKRMYLNGMTQTEIAVTLGVTQKVVWRFMKNHDIQARVPAKRHQNASDNSSWKGDDAGYTAFHSRVYTKYGPAKSYGCCMCGTHSETKTYDWANLTGDYGNPEDYAPMCRSCHRRFDARKRVI